MVKANRSVIVLAIIATVGLAGCAASGAGEEHKTTLEDAKSEIFAVEDEVLALVPDGGIAEAYPRKERSSVLFPCEDGTYIWPGSAEARLTDGADMNEILDSVVETWTDREGWDVTDSGPDGDPREILLAHEGGLRVTVVGLKSNTRLSIGSFSSCFTLDEEYDPFGRY